jgi:ribonuclease P protein component
VFVAESPALRPRLALVVPKHGHKIVQRNRLKRWLREIARRDLLPACRTQERAVDILIRARPEAYRAEFDKLREEITELAESLCLPGSS